MPEKRKMNTTATEVVLMPPAVEPGLPPMNMSMTVRSFEASESAAVSTLLKPAVLGVTAEKKLTSICSPSGMSAFMRPRSRKKKSSAPPKMSMSVVRMTSFVCRS